MKQDITCFEDCHSLVARFYVHLLESDIAYIFTEVAKIDLEPHVRLVAQFWAQILLGTPGYDGNPMAPHITLAKQTPLGDHEFARWLELFERSVDELFQGEVANEAKNRARHIAAVMKFKVNG